MSRLEIPTLEQVAAALDGATEEQIAEFAGAALSRIPGGGWLPRPVFNPIRERARMSTIDVVAFQAGTDGERVLIGQRTNNPEDWWSGQFNLPGSVIVPNEPLKPEDLIMRNGCRVNLGQVTVSRDITSPTDRILGDELKGSVVRTAPVTELERYWVHGGRSGEQKLWTLTEVQLSPDHEDVRGGHFFETQQLIEDPPENLVVGHAYFVELGYHALRAL